MNKLKLFKSMSAIGLMGTMALTGLTSCGKNKESFLSDTILENARVITFEDEHKDIAIVDDTTCNYDECDCTEKVYRSIVTNEYFADDQCEALRYHQAWTSFPLNHYNIINSESIVSYLTVDEIVKAYKNELSDDDINAIVNRVFSNESEKTNVK